MNEFESLVFFDFEDFLYLNHLQTIIINDFSNPIVNKSYSFNIICK